MDKIFGELLDVNNGYPLPSYISDNYMLNIADNKLYLYDELNETNLELIHDSLNKYHILNNDIIIPLNLSDYKDKVISGSSNKLDSVLETALCNDELKSLFEDSDFLNDRYISIIVRQEQYNTMYIFFLIDKYTNIIYHITEAIKYDNNYIENNIGNDMPVIS